MSITKAPMITAEQHQNATGAADAYAIRVALGKILSSDAFSRAQRMRELLHFLVEQKLSGKQRDTQEYAVGIEVFRRDPSTYNTCTDPIVRVQVGRLRDRMRAYYGAAGAADPIRFTIPVGTYMPEISVHGEVAKLAPPRALPVPVASTASGPIQTAKPVEVAEAAPARLRVSGIARHYMLAHQALFYLGEDREGADFVRGLDEELVHQLHCAFGGTIVPRASGARLTAVSHRLEGSVRFDGALVRMALRLVDNKANSIVWSQQFDGGPERTILVQDRLVKAACSAMRDYFAHG